MGQPCRDEKRVWEKKKPRNGRTGPEQCHAGYTTEPGVHDVKSGAVSITADNKLERALPGYRDRASGLLSVPTTDRLWRPRKVQTQSWIGPASVRDSHQVPDSKTPTRKPIEPGSSLDEDLLQYPGLLGFNTECAGAMNHDQQPARENMAMLDVEHHKSNVTKSKFTALLQVSNTPHTILRSSLSVEFSYWQIVTIALIASASSGKF
ncbi:hypothetical protein HD554DRAFT_49503 [Boletus coccyginus]|nr:hypothetical protein HD554DRAFT_49503 [Boletus coccyginus]